MGRRILIVDDSLVEGELTPEALAGYGEIVLAFWASPELERRLAARSGGRVHRLSAVVGGLGHWERRAVDLMERICLGGPSYRGLPWRTLLAEPMVRECLLVQLALDLVEFCRARSGEGREALAAIDLRASDRLAGLLVAAFATTPFAAIVRRLPADGGKKTDTSAGPPLHRRLARRLRHARLTGHWWAQVRNLADELDRTYAWRCRRRWRPAPPLPAPGGTTFFSSYLNNSRILRAIEPLAARPAHWVVTNHYAREGAASTGAPVDWLWRFSPPADGATEGEVADSASLAAGGTAEERRLLVAWLGTSPTWHYWLRTGRLALPRLTRCWESYLERVRPRRVVMAGLWGLEGWLGAVARNAGVPVVQLLHGVLGGHFHTGRPIDADALVVWGEFWRRRWPEPERAKILVANPGGVVRGVRAGPRSSPGRPPRLTYFSWPLDRLDFYNATDLLDGLTDLFDRLLAAGACTLTVRAHPLENPDDLVGHWRRRRGAIPPGVRFSQREPLAAVLAATDLALLYRSTVLLEGFAAGIPMLMPGWLEFDWSGELDGIAGLHLAADFADLERTLEAWLAAPPRPRPEQAERFVAAEGAGVAELTALLRREART